jgi:hypothetical protein
LFNACDDVILRRFRVVGFILRGKGAGEIKGTFYFSAWKSGMSPFSVPFFRPECGIEIALLTAAGRGRLGFSSMKKPQLPVGQQDEHSAGKDESCKRIKGDGSHFRMKQ